MVLTALRSLADSVVTYIRGPLSVYDGLYRIPKSREEGESDLEKLAREEKKEAAWVFSQDEEMWYNVRQGGYRHRGQSETSQSEGLQMVAKIPQNSHGESFTFYHTHPIKTIAQDTSRHIQSTPDILLPLHLAGPKKTGNLEVPYWYQSLVPSVFDIDSDLSVLTHNPRVHIDFRIVSAFGRTDVRYDPDVVKALLENPDTSDFDPLRHSIKSKYYTATTDVKVMLDESYAYGKPGYNGNMQGFIQDVLAILNMNMNQILTVNIVTKPDHK